MVFVYPMNLPLKLLTADLNLKTITTRTPRKHVQYMQSRSSLYGDSEGLKVSNAAQPQACSLDARLDKKRERQIADLYKLRRKSVAAWLLGVLKAGYGQPFTRALSESLRIPLGCKVSGPGCR